MGFDFGAKELKRARREARRQAAEIERKSRVMKREEEERRKLQQNVGSNLVGGGEDIDVLLGVKRPTKRKRKTRIKRRK